MGHDCYKCEMPSHTLTLFPRWTSKLAYGMALAAVWALDLPWRAFEALPPRWEKDTLAGSGTRGGSHVLETGLASVADDGCCLTARAIGEAFSRELFSDEVLSKPAVFFDALIANRLKKVLLVLRHPS